MTHWIRDSRPLIGFILLLWCLPALGEALETAPAERVPVPADAVYDGEVEAVDRSTVAAQTGGRVMELLFDVGDFVEEGSLLVRLRDATQRAAVESAEAHLTEARVRRAEARVELERVERLVERELATEAEFDRAQATFDASVARVRAAEAQLESAREELAQTRIHAPYSGIVVERHIQLGELASPGSPLMTGLSLERLRVVVSAPQRLVGPIRRAGEARVQVRQAPETWIDAEEITIFPQAEPGSHTFRIRAYLPDDDHDLLPGMLVKTAFPLRERERLVVPTEAVFHRSEVTAVYVVDDEGHVAMRQIRPGATIDEARLEVLAGLAEGERVALDPMRAGRLLREQRGLR